MFGYTTEEIKRYFGKRLTDIAKAYDVDIDDIMNRLKDYYDGYTFDGETRVYNPFTVNRFLFTGDFCDFWIQSGHQKFITTFLNDKHIDVNSLEGAFLSKNEAMEPGGVCIDSRPELILYQAGYLTIRKADFPNFFTLAYPNHEVRSAIAVLISNNYFSSNHNAVKARADILLAVLKDDYSQIITVLNNMFSKMCFANNEAFKMANTGEKECQYRNNLITFLLGAGFNVRGEEQTNRGRIDVVAEFQKKTLIIEVKYVDSTPRHGDAGPASAATVERRCRAKLRIALSQFRTGNYAGPYPNPMPLAIVINEAENARISHAAFGSIAYGVHGDPAKLTPIGDIDGNFRLTWRLPAAKGGNRFASPSPRGA